MATKLFVGGLAYSVNDDQLRDFFAEIGEVKSATVIVDREMNRSKGFGFVEMATEEDAKKAVEQLDGKDFEGRTIVVNEARPREDRPQRSFGGGGGGYNRDNNRGGGNRY